MKKLLIPVAMLCAAGLVLAADAPKKDAPASAPAKAAAEKKEAAPAASKAKLSDPASLNEKAPETFDAKFETTKGNFTIHVTRAWSPLGADRFYNLVKNGWYDGVKFFRVIPGFMVQFGINGDPALNKVWQEARFADDPVVQGNKRGFVTFAKCGAPNCRTTQIFINFKDNTGLDGQGFSAFGQVTEGMDAVDRINSQYGEGAPSGRGPAQGRIQAEGNAYLEKDFPALDGVKKAYIAK